MIDFIIVENPDKPSEIWDLNPELNYMEPFATFKKTSRKNASRIMNAIWMIYDPKSKFRVGNKTEEDIIRDVNKNYLGNEDYDWTPYQEIIDSYKENCKTFLQKRLEEWERDLKERDEAIRDLKYSDKEQRKEKDEMLANRDILFNKYLETEAKVKNEFDERRRMKGGYRMSGVEKAIYEKAG